MELLQNRALCWMQKKASAKTCPAAIWQGDIPLGDFRLMGVDGAAAEREENLIHLQLVNTICRSAGTRADVQRTPEMVICTGQPTRSRISWTCSASSTGSSASGRESQLGRD